MTFDAFWKSFELRFDSILTSLRHHQELIDKEAVSFDIIQASEARKKAEEELERIEQERFSSRLQAVLEFLAVDDRKQEDDLDFLSQRRHPDTCKWFLQCSQFQAWLKDPQKVSVLWIWGIPGSGK